MSNEHYFASSPESELKLRTIHARIAGKAYELTTANGIFSPEHIDTGTQVLLANVPAPPPGGNVLDLGDVVELGREAGDTAQRLPVFAVELIAVAALLVVGGTLQRLRAGTEHGVAGRGCASVGQDPRHYIVAFNGTVYVFTH